MTKQEALKIIRKKTPIANVIYTYNEGEYWQIVGEVGGDILTYRVYKNGNIYECAG